MRSLARETSRLSFRAERTAAPSAEELPTPPIRLRFVLAGLLAYATWALLVPRASAAWKLHGRATALADYGACMAGPTAPSLLRDRKLEAVRQLLRRRLVASPPNAAPFARCAALARTLSESSEIEAAHRVPASSFVEYSGRSGTLASLDSLGVSTGGLAELARKAWPLVNGYAALVKPSLSAKEAPHPVAPPAPAVGRGLPAGRALYRATKKDGTGVLLAAGTGANSEALRSDDGGATFRSVAAARVRDISGRCPAGAAGRAFVFSQSDDGATTLLSLEPEGAPRGAPLASANEEIVAFACDEHGAVAALRPDGGTRATLRQCVFASSCSELRPPSGAGTGGQVDHPLDVARVSGTTIVALRMGNVVRVASSRDGGVSWTPFSVAFDGGDETSGGLPSPTELVVIERRVLLHGRPRRPGEPYALLYSDDHGASWHGR